MHGFWGNWKSLFEELWRRLKSPIGQPAFVFYFLGIIIIVGGLGVWFSMQRVLRYCATPQDHITLISSIATYLLAILGAAYAELVLSKKAGPSLQMFSLFVLVVGTLLATTSQAIQELSWAYRSLTVGVFMALFLWWIANADNLRLAEQPKPDAATGGDPTSTPISGSLTGIKT